MKIYINKNLTKYLISISLLFIFLSILKVTFGVPQNEELVMPEYIYQKSNIYINNEKLLIDADYPKFKNKNINKIITSWIYDYVKDFKELSEDQKYSKLVIEYRTYNVDKYMNIFFDINNSINSKDINKSILINLKDENKSSITELYNEDILKENLKLVSSKYPTFISSKILETDYNEFNYLITEEGYSIYFNLDYDRNVSYNPYINIFNSEKVTEESIDPSKRMVAITFDDGPSEYSLEILQCLLLNNSKATFFELGSKMTNKRDITKKLYENGMEIGNHSYSHKYLTRISLSDALNEINSTSIVFNQITGDNLELMRVPYGSVNSTIKKNIPFPIISWSIDTKDWLYRDANISAPIVLDYVEDGDIILMHDIHYATIELVKVLIPELKARGFELVTVSDLAKYKNYTLEPGVVVREIK